MAYLKDLAEYTYFGLGGPFLEDFRVLNDFFGDLKLVSIEVNEEVVKRQQFHCLAGTYGYDTRRSGHSWGDIRPRVKRASSGSITLG